MSEAEPKWDLKRDLPAIREAIRRALSDEREPVAHPGTGEPISAYLIPGRMGVVLSTPSLPNFYREKWGRPPSHHEDDRGDRTSLKV